MTDIKLPSSIEELKGKVDDKHLIALAIGEILDKVPPENLATILQIVISRTVPNSRSSIQGLADYVGCQWHSSASKILSIMALEKAFRQQLAAGNDALLVDGCFVPGKDFTGQTRWQSIYTFSSDLGPLMLSFIFWPTGNVFDGVVEIAYADESMASEKYPDGFITVLGDNELIHGAGVLQDKSFYEMLNVLSDYTQAEINSAE